MKVKFEMVADPVVRAKLESLDFDPEVAERHAHELLELVGKGIDLASIWTNFQYDDENENRVVGYDITRLPVHASKPGRA